MCVSICVFVCVCVCVCVIKHNVLPTSGGNKDNSHKISFYHLMIIWIGVRYHDRIMIYLAPLLELRQT